MCLEDLGFTSKDIDDRQAEISARVMERHMREAGLLPMEDERSVEFTAEERERLERLKAFYEACSRTRDFGEWRIFSSEQQARLDYWDAYIEDLSLDMEIKESVGRTYVDAEGTKYL